MQKYYQRLTKEQKKEIKKIYQKEYKTDINARLSRLSIFSILGFICAIIILVLSFKYEKEHLTSILLAILLFASSLAFILGRTYVKLNLLNKIALKNKKK